MGHCQCLYFHYYQLMIIGLEYLLLTFNVRHNFLYDLVSNININIQFQSNDSRRAKKLYVGRPPQGAASSGNLFAFTHGRDSKVWSLKFVDRRPSLNYHSVTRLSLKLWFVRYRRNFFKIFQQQQILGCK